MGKNCFFGSFYPAQPCLWLQTKDDDTIIFGLEPKVLIEKTLPGPFRKGPWEFDAPKIWELFFQSLKNTFEIHIGS
jgi:hypothetical protein